jgi:hypothetical protein
MDTKHTPEPWAVDSGGDGGCEIWSPSSGNMDNIIGSEDTDDPQWEADARRIVACVNACAGIEDPGAELARLRRVEQAARALCAHQWTDIPAGAYVALRAALED